MVKVEHLYKWYGSKLAVEDMSFSVNKGDVLGFIGPNGAGKSTTMRMITGYMQPSSGDVFICGHNMDDAPLAAKKKMGYLPENAPLYGNMTVYSFLKFAAGIHGLKGAEAKARLDEIIEKCFLQSVRDQRIDTLSKGYRHRVCFAQSIIHDPEILVLDEPTEGLDPNQKREVRRLIKNMGKSKAIILSTHILEEVEALCTRVLVISAGHKVFDGIPAEFKGRSCKSGNVLIRITSEDKKSVFETFEALDGCDRVEIDEKESSFHVRLCPAESISPDALCGKIPEICRKNKWVLLSLRVEEGHLDEVFHEITCGSKG